MVRFGVKILHYVPDPFKNFLIGPLRRPKKSNSGKKDPSGKARKGKKTTRDRQVKW